jgi:hypothetical protein
MPNSTAILPAWLVLPIAVLALIVLAGHLLGLIAAADMDPQRRRIRTTNTVLMMLAVPLVAYGFGIATPAQARTYVYVWVLVSALLFLVVLVAMLDMLHSWRLHRIQLREIRKQMALARSLDARGARLGDDHGR